MHSYPSQNTASTHKVSTHRLVSIAMIIDILRASREVFYFSALINTLPPTERHTTSNTLTAIGAVVKDMFIQLVNDHNPEIACQQLNVLGHQLYNCLHPVLGVSHARTLTEKLEQSHHIEGLQREVDAGIIDMRQLELLDQAAELFANTAEKLHGKA